MKAPPAPRLKWCGTTTPKSSPKPTTCRPMTAAARPPARAHSAGRQRAADARQHASVLRGAGRAQPGDREVGEARPVADRVEHGLAHAVQRRRRQRRGLAAALAQDELARAAGGLVEPGPVAEVDVADEAEALEDLEVAIGRGDVAVAGELLGAQRPVGVEQRLQQQPPRGRQAQAVGADGGEGGRGGRRLHRRREVWNGHESTPPGRSPHPHGAFWVLLRTTRRSGSHDFARPRLARGVRGRGRHCAANCASREGCPTRCAGHGAPGAAVRPGRRTSVFPVWAWEDRRSTAPGRPPARAPTAAHSFPR